MLHLDYETINSVDPPVSSSDGVCVSNALQLKHLGSMAAHQHGRRQRWVSEEIDFSSGAPRGDQVLHVNAHRE